MTTEEMIVFVMIAVFVLVLIIIFVRMPKKHEILSVYEMAKAAKQDAITALEILTELKLKVIPKFLDATEQSLKDISEDYKRELVDRSNTVINGSYFLKAAKAALPRRKWKEEFQEYADAPERQLIDFNGLESDIAAITTKAQQVIENRVKEGLSKTQKYS